MVQDVGEHERDSQHEQHERLKTAVRGIVADSDGPVSTEGVSETLTFPRETARELLAELAADGEVTNVRPGGAGDRWTIPDGSVQVTAEANSYRVTDPETGLVTRDGTRPGALRRLADRIEQYRTGDTVVAQLVGISEAVLSPEYAKSADGLVEAYVEPLDRQLYVYVADEGVREVTTAEQLSRNHDVLGFAVTGQYTAAEYDAATPVALEEIFDRTRVEKSHFPLGVFKLIAVHPDHHGEGVGSELRTHGMAHLAEDPPLLTMLWVRENDGNIKLAETAGFTFLAAFENTSPSKWQCPECGFDTACTCSALLYGRGFD